MTNQIKKHGGARKGAGRLKLPDEQKAKSRTIRMTDAHYAKYRALGGAKWFKSMLEGATL
ncbi:MAG: hypothetical protein RLZZ469_1644 [Bacteroidota bacterium]